MRVTKLTYLLLGLLMTISSVVLATHNRAGEITYKKIGPLEYQFTLVVYTEVGPVIRDRATISFGDGTLSSDVFYSEDKFIAPNFKKRTYQYTHTFPSSGEYFISYKDENRNDSVLNMTNSVGTAFYIETYLLIDPLIGFNTSPILLLEPLDFGNVGQVFLHNPNPFDIDGDSLSFELVPCKQDVNTEVNNFIFPSPGNNLAKNSFTINTKNGSLRWDFPLRQGLYNIAIKISEFRNGRLIGYIIRDMQIPILATKNNTPRIVAIADTCIIAGDTLSQFVLAKDEPFNGAQQKVTLSATGGPFEVDPAAEFTPRTELIDVSQIFTWNTTCRVARGQPYTVVFKAIDNASAPLNDLYTWQISVLAPAPTLRISSVEDNIVRLDWDYDSLCINKALGYYIYRKKGSDTLSQDLCERGMAPDWGYALIATIKNGKTFTYVDEESEGLDRGNVYCYRIVAYFPDRSVSKVSEKACAEIYKDVPVITNVSVLNTSTTQGKIHVEWSKPALAGDTVLKFTPPYEFKLYQAIANTASPSYQLIQSFRSNSYAAFNDTLFDVENLNTVDNQYVYKVEFWSNIGDLTQIYDTIGTSNPATSVYLSALPSDNQVQLTWNEKVPWLNTAYAVYRIRQGTDTVLIKATNLPTYTDSNLTNGVTYSYVVQSVGAYTLSLFKKPLLNYSEVVSAIPEDTMPPCKPVLTAVGNCDLFTDTLTWSFSEPSACLKEIVGYKVYRSFFIDEEPTLIQTINNRLQMELTLLNQRESIAGCFTIVAVDSIGLESISNKVCIDNCPGIVLPNVFTPNGDGFNDVFKPFDGDSSRFYNNVEFYVYNRWGQKVFQTSSNDILWDGTNSFNGSLLEEGVYFYVCKLDEISVYGLKPRTIKGYITLLRD